jgi:hypothetical protein
MTGWDGWRAKAQGQKTQASIASDHIQFTPLYRTLDPHAGNKLARGTKSAQAHILSNAQAGSEEEHFGCFLNLRPSVHRHQALSVAAVKKNARNEVKQSEHGLKNVDDSGGNAQGLEHG